MLYLYLLIVTSTSLTIFYWSSLIFTSELGSLFSTGWVANAALSELSFALISGTIWWLHWRRFTPIWPQGGSGRRFFAKLYIGSAAVFLMFGVLVSGSITLETLLRGLFYRGNNTPYFLSALISSGLTLAISAALWRLHWRQIKLHSGPTQTISS